MRSTLFTIFGLPIRSYGLMMVIGFLLAVWRATRAAKRLGINPDRVWDLGVVTLLAGVVGARLVYVLLNPATESFAGFLKVWEGGLSFHGGLGFAIAAAYGYAKYAKLGFWPVVDLCTPSVAIGYAVTRIGCFLNGCCYGAPTSLPWGVRFMENGQLTPPSHPTQIYSAIINLLIFLVLVRLERIEHKPGFIFCAYVGLYGLYRFLVEFPRKGYSAEVFALGLTQAQVASLVMIAVSVALTLTVFRRADKQNKATRK